MALRVATVVDDSLSARCVFGVLAPTAGFDGFDVKWTMDERERGVVKR